MGKIKGNKPRVRFNLMANSTHPIPKHDISRNGMKWITMSLDRRREEEEFGNILLTYLKYITESDQTVT